MRYRYIFDQLAKDYDCVTTGWVAASHILDLLIDQIKLRDQRTEDLNIVDFGIGTGKSSEGLYALNCMITGVDISKKMLKKAREKLSNIKTVTADVRKKIPFEDNQFDYSIACGLFEFIENYERTLKDILRITKRNGLVALTFELCLDDVKQVTLAPGYSVYRRQKRELLEYLLRLNLIYHDEFIAYKSPSRVNGKIEDISFLAAILKKA